MGGGGLLLEKILTFCTFLFETFTSRIQEKNWDETYFTPPCTYARYPLCTQFLSSYDIWSWIFTCTDKSFDLHVRFYKVYGRRRKNRYRSDIQPIFYFCPLLNVKKNQKETYMFMVALNISSSIVVPWRRNTFWPFVLYL